MNLKREILGQIVLYTALGLFLLPASPSFAAAEGTKIATTDNDVVVIADGFLSDDEMGMKRGAGGITNVVSTQTLTSTSNGNVMNVGGDLTNGSITTGSNFGGSGFGSFVMNTGNNAVINSGVSVSVLMQP